MKAPRIRIEKTQPPRGSTQYYLVRDVWFMGRKKKVRHYLGTHEPDQDELARLRQEHGPSMEMVAIGKKAELAADHYQTEHLHKDEVQEVEYVRFLFQAARALMSADELRVYKQEFDRRYIHGTTTIEGNTLSLDETVRLLEQGKAPKDKPLREINEVQNFHQVLKVRDAHKGNVDLRFIKKLHLHIMANIDLDSPGEFRRIDGVAISGSDIRVAPAIAIEQELQTALDDYYRSIKDGYHPYEQAVFFHYRFEIIHPFLDGNGRVGREILNYMLKDQAYPRLLFLGEEREEYIGALRQGNQEKYHEMLKSFIELTTLQRAAVLAKNVENLMAKKSVSQKRLFDFIPKGD